MSNLHVGDEEHTVLTVSLSALSGLGPIHLLQYELLDTKQNLQQSCMNNSVHHRLVCKANINFV
jgi:hypothetical protein